MLVIRMQLPFQSLSHSYWFTGKWPISCAGKAVSLKVKYVVYAKLVPPSEKYSIFCKPNPF